MILIAARLLLVDRLIACCCQVVSVAVTVRPGNCST
jgi:hypothetical protein